MAIVVSPPITFFLSPFLSSHQTEIDCFPSFYPPVLSIMAQTGFLTADHTVSRPTFCANSIKSFRLMYPKSRLKTAFSFLKSHLYELNTSQLNLLPSSFQPFMSSFCQTSGHHSPKMIWKISDLAFRLMCTRPS